MKKNFKETTIDPTVLDALGFFWDGGLRRMRSGEIKGRFLVLVGSEVTFFSREESRPLKTEPTDERLLPIQLANLMA